jgi:hypothetical protein
MSSKPTFIRFPLEPNDDEEITCVFCTMPRCDQAYRAAGGGKVSFYGVHNSCAEKHMDKLTKTTTSE